jgi:hypothetical protein
MVYGGNTLGSIVTVNPLLKPSKVTSLFHSWKYSLIFIAQTLLCGPPAVILKAYEFGARILFVCFVCSEGKQRFPLPPCEKLNFERNSN